MLQSGHDQHLLQQRDELSRHLISSPYDPVAYLKRAKTYQCLGYPDLSCMDMYKLLLLLDEINDEDGEYHHAAFEASQAVFQNGSRTQNQDAADCSSLSAWASHLHEQALVHLAHCLSTVGCQRSALETIRHAMEIFPRSPEIEAQHQRLQDKLKHYSAGKSSYIEQFCMIGFSFLVGRRLATLIVPRV